MLDDDFAAVQHMIDIDGSQGEGGGQILRTSLALATITQQPVSFHRIRAGRDRPGLQRQHLAAVNAAAEVCGGSLSGAALGSTELTFRPGGIRPGDYRFDIGSAGSTSLVLQTVLPPLMTADGPSTLVLEGGTHNPWAPPLEFLTQAFLPILERIGPRVTTALERYGFAPAGGGRVSVSIEPAASLCPIALGERGEIQRQYAEALIARLPVSIAERELAVLRDRLGWTAEQLGVLNVMDSAGPGNIVIVRVVSEFVTEVFTAVGRKGLPAEDVAAAVASQTERYLAADVPVDEHLADQLLLPLALAGGGSFVTTSLSLHSQTNIDVIRRFLPVTFDVTQRGPDQARVEVRSSRATSP